MLHTTGIDKFVRKQLESLGLSKYDVVKISKLDIEGNKLYYKEELIKNNLTDLEAEMLLVITGDKTKFGCPYADQLECKKLLKISGLTEKQVEEVVNEENLDKRSELFQSYIKTYEQDLQGKNGHSLIIQRSLYHANKKPLRLVAFNDYVDCAVGSTKKEDKCDIIKGFNADGEETLSLLQKIENLVWLDHPEWSEEASKLMETPVKEKNKSLDEFME